MNVPDIAGRRNGERSVPPTIAAPPSFGIAGNGLQLSASSDRGVTITGLTVSSTRVTVVTPAAVDAVTVKVYLVSGDEIPRFIGGDMSLPAGTTLTMSVDNGPSETVDAGATWSIGTG